MTSFAPAASSSSQDTDEMMRAATSSPSTSATMEDVSMSVSTACSAKATSSDSCDARRDAPSSISSFPPKSAPIRITWLVMLSDDESLHHEIEPSQMTKISHTIYQSPLSQALKVDQIPGYDYQLESRITTVSEKVAVPFLCRFLGQDKYPKRFDFAFMHARCLEKLLDIPRGDVDSAKSKGELAELFTTHASSKGSLNLLENSDIVVVPSPLLFAGMRGYQPTVERLLQLSETFQFRIYPDLNIEQEMENKNLYAHKMLQSPAFIGVNSLAPAQCYKDEPQLESISCGAVECCAYALASMNNMAPSLILPSFGTQSKKYSQADFESVLKSLYGRLAAEMEKMGLDKHHDKDTVLLKGINATRSSSCCRFEFGQNRNKREKQFEYFQCIRDGRESYQLGGIPQPGFIIQLVHVTLFSNELRMYFIRGQHVSSIQSSADQSKLGVEPSGEPAEIYAFEVCPWKDGLTEDEQESCAMRILDKKERDRTVWNSRLSTTGTKYNPTPILVAFAQHILGLAESFCRLVTETAVLRVDLFYEIELVAIESPATEAQIEAAEKKHIEEKQLEVGYRERWIRTGKGAVILPFLNELTSTGDINFFSQNHRTHIVNQAAGATLLRLHQIGKDMVLKGGQLDRPFADEWHQPSIHSAARAAVKVFRIAASYLESASKNANNYASYLVRELQKSTTTSAVSSTRV